MGENEEVYRPFVHNRSFSLSAAHTHFARSLASPYVCVRGRHSAGALVVVGGAAQGLLYR